MILRPKEKKLIKANNHNEGQKGQALLESLIGFGVFFVFVFGILYMTLLYQSKLWLHHISYENALCLYYSERQDQCLKKSRKFMTHAFPYLDQIKITFQSRFNYQESIIQAYFPPYAKITAKESFYAKY